MLRRGNKSLKPWHGPQNHRLTVLTTFLIILLVVSAFLFQKKGGKANSSFKPTEQKWNSFESSVQFYPTAEFRNGTDVIWQIPGSPRAVLFLAHGCNGRAVNFWDRSPMCQNCVGLPEERLIVLHALARRFAVLTVSSAGRCWSFGEERLIVKGIIRWWIEENKLEKLPLFALGASSGGYFVSVLAAELRFSSIALMIAEGLFDEMDVREDYPPTLFVHMPKDQFRKKRIDENIDFLRNKGIEAEGIRCMEFPMSPNFLADRIPALDQTTSFKLYELFHDKGFVDNNGYMRKDGRTTKWKEALKERNILLPDKHLLSHIQEEMNLAFAYHEFTSLQSEQIFNWFELHLN
ncbi:uncharacterized protein LOC131148968 [Malania oleifera]|uniref:uncharacterized protein LOC131148968 n=1 Tax=Malania oleifera TaxID=397392 RepID=UPI0025AEC023|nr:uncharacterized protein LOC131148968 [Malania oleifera]